MKLKSEISIILKFRKKQELISFVIEPNIQERENIKINFKKTIYNFFDLVYNNYRAGGKDYA
jgi:hypothetical protein